MYSIVLTPSPELPAPKPGVIAPPPRPVPPVNQPVVNNTCKGFELEVNVYARKYTTKEARAVMRQFFRGLFYAYAYQNSKKRLVVNVCQPQWVAGDVEKTIKRLKEEVEARAKKNAIELLNKTCDFYTNLWKVKACIDPVPPKEIMTVTTWLKIRQTNL